jgi:hypothetical protein
MCKFAATLHNVSSVVFVGKSEGQVLLETRELQALILANERQAEEMGILSPE